MARLRDAPDDHFALVGAAAEALGLPAGFVEKDYWITELLRSLAAPVGDAFVVFKGGTSLSKGYGLLRRFSEAVDVLLVVTRARDPRFGKGAVDGILKRLCTRAREDLGLAPGDAHLEGSSRGLHRNVRYGYAARYEAPAVKPGVLLELGVRGGAEPRETREFRSLAARHAVETLGEPEGAFDEFAPVSIPVLHPVRTLLEKLATLHHLASGLPATGTDLLRAARHLYDVHELLRDPGVRGALGGSSRVAGEVAADVERTSRVWGWPFTPRPPGGYAASPAFDPGHPSQEILARGLAAIRDLIVGEVPTLEECRAAVAAAANLL